MAEQLNKENDKVTLFSQRPSANVFRDIPVNIAVASLIGSGMFPMSLTSDPSTSGRGREDMAWTVLRSCSSFRMRAFCSALVRTADENSTCSSA